MKWCDGVWWQLFWNGHHRLLGDGVALHRGRVSVPQRSVGLELRAAVAPLSVRHAVRNRQRLWNAIAHNILLNSS